MKTYKRETPRQALIRTAAIMLAKDYPGSTEQNYRQNCWQYIEPCLVGFIFRARYFTHLSPLGKTRLYGAIARRAVIENRFNNQRSSDHYTLSVDRPTHWSGQRSTFKHFD